MNKIWLTLVNAVLLLLFLDFANCSWIILNSRTEVQQVKHLLDACSQPHSTEFIATNLYKVNFLLLLLSSKSINDTVSLPYMHTNFVIRNIRPHVLCCQRQCVLLTRKSVIVAARRCDKLLSDCDQSH